MTAFTAAYVRKKLLIFAAAVLTAVLLSLLGGVTAYAADGSGAYGARLPDYNSGKEINVTDCGADSSGKSDSADAIQEALDTAKESASDTNRVVVKIPAGTYKISKTLKIYSNTQLILDENATVIKEFNSGAMLRNGMTYGGGGYKADRNIVVQGGTWDGNTSAYNSVYSFSNFRFAHASNLIFRNVTILNNKNGHHLELGGVQGVTVDGCSFSGYVGSLLKEAIQLDVMHSEELFTGYSPFDDTPCDNVIIKNCSFSNLPRAIGSHSAVVGVYYTNVTIKNNSFSNITDICMVLYNYKKCTVSGNKIKKCGAGITFNYMTDESFRHYFTPLIGNSKAKANFSDNADTVIESNTIETVQTTLRLSPFAIKLYGDNVSSDTEDYPAYNYRIGNVSIKSNSIKTAGTGITMNDVYGVSLSSNDITVNSGADCVDSDLITLSDCSDISFKKNTVKNSSQTAMRVNGSDGVTVSGNAFSDNVSCAVVFTDTANSTVSKNTASNSGKGAVKISEGCSQITVSGNVIKNSTSYGIQISAAGSGKKDIMIKSNDISGGSVGISCVNDAKAFLMSNSFEAVSDKVYAESDGMLTLGKPKNFNAEEVTENRIKITWSSLGEADGIDVYRRRAGMADFELIATLESGALFQDEKLVAGTNYFYKIVPYIIIGDEKCETTSSREIEARTKLNIENAYIDCVSSAGFTSRPITPKITIKAYSRELTAGVDYDYSFSNNLYPGTATVTVVGKGNYSGTLTHSFEITLSDRSISNAETKNLLSGSAFSTEAKRSYEVTCTSTGGMLLADSDETLNPIQLSIEAIRVRVPVCVTVTTAVWTDSGYEYFGR